MEQRGRQAGFIQEEMMVESVQGNWLTDEQWRATHDTERRHNLTADCDCRLQLVQPQCQCHVGLNRLKFKVQILPDLNERMSFRCAS